MLWEGHQNEAGVTVEVVLISHNTGDVCPQPQGLWRAPSSAFLGHTARGFLMALRFLEENERALEALRHAELWAQQVLQVPAVPLPLPAEPCA